MRSPVVQSFPALRDIAAEFFRIVRFSIVGIGASVCYAIITFMLVKGDIAGPVLATIIGHLGAGVISYFGHLRFSFAVRSDHRTFLWRFLMIAALAFGVNIGLTWFLATVLGLSYVISIAAVMILIPIINYLCSRFWVFLPGIERATAMAGSAKTHLQQPRACDPS